MGTYHYQMNKQKKQQRQITMACLNYSGVQESPFQFYEDENEKQIELNKLFGEMCSKYVDNFDSPDFKWSIGKLDKQWHNRLSPLYMPECGIIQNRLMTREQFENQWEKYAKTQFPKKEKLIYDKLTPEQKQKKIPKQLHQCKLFDLCAYLALLKFIYGTDSNKVQLNSKAYKDFQNSMFGKSFLNIKLKQQKTINAIKKDKTDVFFLHEADIDLITEISQKFPEFHITQKFHAHNTSAIFIRKQSFPKVNDFRLQNQNFILQYLKRTKCDATVQLNWNDDSVFQVAENYIFISAHLSSKKQKNALQIKTMKQYILKLDQHFPEYEIIVGGDLNGYCQYGFQIDSARGKPRSIHVFPNAQKDCTVLKKRTLMQVQKNKANQRVQDVKDYFVSTLPFQFCCTATINGTQVKKGGEMPLLPNNQHPYDHYLVVAKIILPK